MSLALGIFYNTFHLFLIGFVRSCLGYHHRTRLEQPGCLAKPETARALTYRRRSRMLWR